MTGKLDIPSSFSAASQVERKVLDALARHGYGEASTFGIRLALEEGLSNAIQHGNSCDPGKVVRVTYDVDGERAAITIRDQGAGFDLSAVPDPTTDENIEKPTGRGIMLMRAYMDELRFTENGAKIHMVRRKD